MIRPTRRHFLRTLAAAGAGVMARRAVAGTTAPPALRRLAGGRPMIGAAVPTRFAETLGERGMRLLAEHFDCVTPENCMKWPELSPAMGEKRFEAADRLIGLAAANHQKVVGHTLVFNREGCYPDWIFRDGGKEADPQLVWRRIEEHVTNLMERYKGRVIAWDVLNEFVEAPDPGYRRTDLTRVLGGDFPVRLFKLAADIDPHAKLIYNDYGLEEPARRKAILAFVRSLLDRGCRVDIIGSQSHIGLDERIGGKIEATIRECAALGLRTAITELDVDVVPRNPRQDQKARAKAALPDSFQAPADILEKQAEVYRQVFQAVAAHRQHVDRVTFWGVTDASSWLNHWPSERVNHALLFDRSGQPKPAFHAVAKVLTDTR